MRLAFWCWRVGRGRALLLRSRPIPVSGAFGVCSGHAHGLQCRDRQVEGWSTSVYIYILEDCI